MADHDDADLLASNKKLADMLKLISSYYSLIPDPHRARTYNIASIAVAQYPDPITSGSQAQKEIKGIGKSVSADIDEFLIRGYIQRLSELESSFRERTEIVNFFLSFYGIGPVTAMKLYDQGLRSLEDLWFKTKLTEAQKIGILWRHHLEIRIPRDEMDLISTKIAEILNPYHIKWEIAGSYRRAEQSSGDIDLLIESRPDLNMDGVLSLLNAILPATLAKGDTKYMGILRLSDEYNGHRIDIRLIPPENWPFALLYFTGSQRFNILLRQRANQLGLILNEYNLCSENNKTQCYPANTEHDIFNILKVKYLSPPERTNNLPILEYL